MAKKKKDSPKRTLITIVDYANRCGLTTQRIYQLIDNKEIGVVKIQDRMFIDMNTTPIYAKKKRGVKSSEEILKANS